MVLGRLMHYGVDAVLLSTVLAGVRRSSGFTCVACAYSIYLYSHMDMQGRNVEHDRSYGQVVRRLVPACWRDCVRRTTVDGGELILVQTRHTELRETRGNRRVL
jgi:hypothetical protein